MGIKIKVYTTAAGKQRTNYTVTHHGQRIRGYADSRAEAEEIAYAINDELRMQVRENRTGIPRKRTLDMALVRWLENDAKALRGYRSLLSHASSVVPFIEGRPLSDVSTIAKDMTKAMLAQGLKPATVNQRLAVLRRLAWLAKEWRWTTESPEGLVKLLPPRNRRVVHMTPDEVWALADAMIPAARSGTHPDQGRDAVLTLAYTGLRKGELFSPFTTRAGDFLVITDTKNERPHRVPVPAAITHVKVPLQLTYWQFRKRFDRAREMVGRPGLHCHDLRHVYAGWLINDKVDLHVVSRLLNHSSTKVTEDRYAHLLDTTLTEATDRLKGRLVPAAQVH